MKAIFLMLCSMVILVASAIAEEKPPEEVFRLPQDAVDALTTGTEFVLYSLDPGAAPSLKPRGLASKDEFYGFKSLGQLALTDPKMRAAAVGAVTDAIHHADRHYMARCFSPRHALRVTAAGRVFDFVICYECGQIRLFEKGNFVATIGIPSTPEALNQLLSEAGIPLAEPPRKEKGH